MVNDLLPLLPMRTMPSPWSTSILYWIKVYVCSYTDLASIRHIGEIVLWLCCVRYVDFPSQWILICFSMSYWALLVAFEHSCLLFSSIATQRKILGRVTIVEGLLRQEIHDHDQYNRVNYAINKSMQQELNSVYTELEKHLAPDELKDFVRRQINIDVGLSARLRRQEEKIQWLEQEIETLSRRSFRRGR